MNDFEDPIDIDTVSKTSEDGLVVTVTLTAPKRMTTSDVILELEYLITQMSRAEDYFAKPGALAH